MNVLGHVGHCVSDLERATRFYVEGLGFAVRNELTVPDAATSVLLAVAEPVGLTARYLVLDNFVLELLVFDRPGNAPQRDRDFTEPGLTHLSFTVEDLDATYTRLAELGGEVLPAQRVGDVAAMVRDPDGQLIELLRGKREA